MTTPIAYENLTTASDITRKEEPAKETPAQRRKKWHNMTPEQIIAATPAADLARFANRGAPMAITELQRRTTQEHEANAATRSARRKEPGIFNTQAEILGDQHNRFADRVIPDQELDIGV